MLPARTISELILNNISQFSSRIHSRVRQFSTDKLINTGLLHLIVFTGKKKQNINVRQALFLSLKGSNSF